MLPLSFNPFETLLFMNKEESDKPVYVKAKYTRAQRTESTKGKSA